MPCVRKGGRGFHTTRPFSLKGPNPSVGLGEGVASWLLGRDASVGSECEAFLLHTCLLSPPKQEGIRDIAAAIKSPEALRARNRYSVGSPQTL